MKVKATTRGLRFSVLALGKRTGLDHRKGRMFRRRAEIDVDDEVGRKLVEGAFATDLTPSKPSGPKTGSPRQRSTAQTEKELSDG